MKPATVIALAATAAAQNIQVEVRYSKEMVDVGDLDIFGETWEKIYAEDGNNRAVLLDNVISTNGGECMHYTAKPDNNVRVIINGQWGKVDGLGITDSREALVKSLNEVLDKVSAPTGWNVFTNCYGTTWQEGTPNWEGPHACGGADATVRPDCFCDIGSAQCEFHSWGHFVPSMIKANMYRDDKLLPDTLQIEFSSQKVEKDDGCGTTGDIISTLTGFLPGPGSLFATGIDIFCS